MTNNIIGAIPKLFLIGTIPNIDEMTKEKILGDSAFVLKL